MVREMSSANVESIASLSGMFCTRASHEFGRISEYKYLQTRLRSALNIRYIANFFANITTFLFISPPLFSRREI